MENALAHAHQEATLQEIVASNVQANALHAKTQQLSVLHARIINFPTKDNVLHPVLQIQ